MEISIGVPAKRVHFIGIGGVSMSALAELLFYSGFTVSGSDLRENANTEKLAALGIRVIIGHAAGNVQDAEAVVYTDAVSPDNEELLVARCAGKAVLDRGTLLGRVAECFAHCVAISGTHGKTTASSMTAAIFMAAGKNPTVHVGASVAGVADGIRMGGDGYFITEACEYKRNFLKIPHETSVVLNVDNDHLDYFTGMEDIVDAYTSFLRETKGHCVVNGDDIVLRSAKERLENPITFGIRTACDYRAEGVKSDSLGRFSFTLNERGERLGRISLSIIGRHNVYNALAAAAAARVYDIGFEAVKEGLEGYSGADRRLQYCGRVRGADVVADYAHHPSEIRAVMEAVRHVTYRRLIVVFEPHTYSRLSLLFPDFLRCFRGADKIVLAKVFAAREKPIKGVNSRALAAGLKKKGFLVCCPGSYERIAAYLSRSLREGDLILVLGAGDIDKVIKLIQ